MKENKKYRNSHHEIPILGKSWPQLHQSWSIKVVENILHRLNPISREYVSNLLGKG